MAKARNLKIAVAQIASVPGDLEANCAKHIDVIDDARSKDADVLMFPEVSLTGHAAGPEALRLALLRDDEIIRRIAEASGPMMTIFGLIEEGPAAQFYNCAMVVMDGELKFIHRKINLPNYGFLEEGKHYAAGRYVDTFKIEAEWRASVLICADLWNPALVWLAALHGATVLFTPISSAAEAVSADFDNPGGWDVNLRFFAMTYGMPVVMANRVGSEGDLTFWGGSRVLDPFGHEITRAGREEELILADLKYDEVRKARFVLPTVRDSNLALILRETHRLVDVLGVPNIIRG